jgi:PAS domain S-box-containing protein
MGTESQPRSAQPVFAGTEHDVGALYEALFAHSSDGVLLTRPDGTTLRANPSACRLLGRTEDELRRIGRDGLAVRTPGFESMLATRERTGTMTGEVAFRRADGSLVLVEMTSTVTRLARGDDVSLIIFRDVSETRRRERELTESEARLRLFVENAPIAVAMLDRALCYVATSRQWTTQYRLPEGSLVGRHHYEVFPEIPERWREVHRAALAGLPQSGEEERFPRADGTVDWVTWRAQPWYDHSGAVGGIVLLTDVVTRRVDAEAALRRSVERYRDLVETSPVAVMVNRGGRVDYVNAAALALFGARSADQLLGTPVLDRFDPESHDLVRKRIEALLRGDKVPTIENRIVRLDGAKRDVEVAGTRFEDASGPAIQVALRDVTERRQLAAMARLDSIGRLAGGIAHDFNNLVTIMLGSAEALRSDLRPCATPSVRTSVDDIEQAARRAAELTKQLLAFARRQAVTPRALSPNAAVVNAEKLLRRVLGHDVALTLDLAPDPWLLRADPAQLDQVLLNLAANARDAMPAGGKLGVRTRNANITEPRVDVLPGLCAGDYVAIDVSDTGCGIPADVRAHVFEPLYTTKPEGMGTGLGLSVVFGVVSQSGGAIEIDSEPGRGTTFTLYFPRLTPGAAA